MNVSDKEKMELMEQLLLEEADKDRVQRDIEALKEKYEEDVALGHRSSKSKFDYAWALIRSSDKYHIRQGIYFLNDLLHENWNAKDCLYYQAVGYYRMSDYVNSSRVVERLLELSPKNRQALTLKSLIDDNIRRDGLIGLGLAGIVVAGIGIVAAALTKKR
eukprot:Rmarinus@m.11201